MMNLSSIKNGSYNASNIGEQLLMGGVPWIPLSELGNSFELIGESPKSRTYIGKWENASISELVAIKKFKKDKINDFVPDFIKYFNCCTHPNILKPYGVYYADINKKSAEFWMVSELMMPLSTIIPIHSKQKLYAIAEGIALGLDHLHSTVPHGSLICSNVFVSTEFHTSNTFEVKISEFALNKFNIDGFMGSSPTKENYRSKESFNHLFLRKEHDLYAYGMIFNSMISGKEPFAGLDNTTIYNNIICGKIELSKDCEIIEVDLINKCLDSKSGLTAAQAARSCHALRDHIKKAVLISAIFNDPDKSNLPVKDLQAYIYDIFMKVYLQ